MNSDDRGSGSPLRPDRAGVYLRPSLRNSARREGVALPPADVEAGHAAIAALPSDVAELHRDLSSVGRGRDCLRVRAGGVACAVPRFRAIAKRDLLAAALAAAGDERRQRILVALHALGVPRVETLAASTREALALALQQAIAREVPR